MSVKLNGDFHEFEFKGSAQDIIDSVSFTTGQGGATTFPAEPAARHSIIRRCREIWGRCGWAFCRTSSSRFRRHRLISGTT